MKKASSIKKVVDAWFRKADHDPQMAEIVVRNSEDINDLISFHAQQCAEKYLKGALVFLQIEFTKTHDLKKVCKLLQPAWPDMPFSCDEVEDLTQYAIAARYPAEWEDITRQEALQAIAMAKRVREAVKAFLQTKGWKDA